MILDEGLGNHKAYDEGHNRKKENPECRNHPAFRVYLYLYYITDVDPFRAMVPNPTHKRNPAPARSSSTVFRMDGREISSSTSCHRGSDRHLVTVQGERSGNGVITF